MNETAAVRETIEIVCVECGAVNRLQTDRLDEGPRCGRCHDPLFPGRPAELDEAGFLKQVERSGIPVVVDFWAPWCGPCRMMAPNYADAAKQLEPRFRLVKVNTEAHPGVGARLGIRSIPTIALFRDGREIARQSGAMSRKMLIDWLEARRG